jgi:hypothetical protein
MVGLQPEESGRGGRPLLERPNVPESNPLADIGKRASETITLHILGGNIGKWVALKLLDGSSDGIPYDTRRDAIRHQLHEQLCCYVKVPADGMPEADALRFILLNRALYAAGYRLADPESEAEPIYPETLEETMSWILRAGEGIV